MKLPGKKTKASGRRQRVVQDSQPNSPMFVSRTRRTEDSANTGRFEAREKPRLGAAGPIRYWLQRLGLIVLLAAVLASVANIVTLSGTARVEVLNTQGGANFLHDQASYQAAADKLLAASVWNRNKITIDTGTISHDMTRQFPELAAVSVTLPLFAHHAIVYLEPAEPALVLNSGSGSYVLDTTGKALETSVKLDAATQKQLPVVTDQSGLQVAPGQQVISSSDASFIRTVQAQLAAKQIGISGMTLPAAASELDVQLVGQPYFVKFNLQTDDSRHQAGAFLATRAQLQKQGVTPAHYIDVRVPGRAYYQ